jgi:hypothetical protein
MTEISSKSNGPRLQTTDQEPTVRAHVGIDLDELEADRRDPEWQAFLKRAKAYRRHLRLSKRLR